MTKHVFRKLGMFVAAGALMLGAAACEDDPADPGDDHGEPVFVRLMLDGAEIARASAVNLGTSAGGIEVAAGEDSAPITVEFLDADDDVIAFDDDFHLEVEVGDESVALFEQDTPGAFVGRAHGVAVGATTMTFRLMHGAVGSGHADFQSAAIDVEVVEGGGAA